MNLFELKKVVDEAIEKYGGETLVYSHLDTDPTSYKIHNATGIIIEPVHVNDLETTWGSSFSYMPREGYQTNAVNVNIDA